MGIEGRPVEEADALIMKRAYYVLGISIVGLLFAIVNWIGISSVTFDIMSVRRVMLSTMYYVVPMATAMAGFAITQLPSALLLSRVGNRVSMFLGLLLNGLSLIFSTTSSYHTALFLRFLAGMGFGLYLAPSLLLLIGWWSIRGLTRWVQVAYLSAITVAITLASIMALDITQTATLYLGLASIVMAVVVLFTMKDAVIIRRVSVMAIMNNPDVLMLGIAFSLPWGVYLSLIPLVTHLSGTLGTAALTIPLVLTPLLYRFRHSVKVERRRVLFFATIALGILTAAMGMRIDTYYLLPAMGLTFTLIMLLMLYLVNELVSPILVVQSTSYLLTVSSTIGSIVGIIMAYAIQYLGQLGWVIIGVLILASSMIYRILKITL